MPSKYEQVISKVFFDNYKKNERVVPFDRQELADACRELSFSRIKNLGDIPYSFRFRKDLPDDILNTCPKGAEWIIVGKGIGLYEFRLSQTSKIEPAVGRLRIKIPDATPEIVKLYAPANDEQALLTKVRYNRAIDLFLGLTCYSIQNHLRTTVAGIGQIEIDEIYLGINKEGEHYVMPCQAKSPGDKFGIVQVMQDKELCSQKYPQLICKPIAMQFLSNNSFAMLALDIVEEKSILKLVVVEEKHYTLVNQNEITHEDLEQYRKYSSQR